MFNNRKVQPGKIKPKSRTMLSLGLAAIMLVSVPGQIILTYALTDQRGEEQSVAAESGYRLYADSLTAASGLIKGDATELLPEYKVSHVVLPDGSTSPAEEVSYSITESGDYTFEVVYEAMPEEKISDTAEQEENVQPEEIRETTNEEPATEITEIEAPGSEKLTLTVTLPAAEEKADAPVEQEETQSEEQSSSPNLTSLMSSTMSDDSQETTLSTRSVMSESNVRAAFGGYDYNSLKKWSSTDFSTHWLMASYTDMNYSTDPTEVLVDDLSISNNSQNGAMVRFGKKLGEEINYARWLQQGAAFSDIRFDFNKDFALVGFMRIGNDFGAPKDAIDDLNIQIDGGVTVSFIPESQIQTARNNALAAKGAAYRLGAYGTLPNSIVCEFDTSTDTYYQRNDSSGRNFVISREDIEKTGDYKYSSDSEWTNNLPGKNIYDLAEETSATHYGNVAHIGISTTDASTCYVTNQNNSSDRCALGSSNTGLISYEVEFKASTKTIYFRIRETDNDLRTVEMNLASYLNNLKSSDKNSMRLAFTFGAAYENVSSFINNSFFTGTNGGSGQIDIYANELYVSPDLKTTATKVKWLQNSTDVVSDDNTYVAYNNAQNYSDRKFWPVAGDRVYTQFSFVPSTDIMPQPTSTLTGNLKLRVGDLKITDESGKEITGLTVGSKEIYIRNNNNSGASWTAYNSNNGISISGKGTVDVRIQLNLPGLDVGSSYSGYSVSGTVYGDYTIGGSGITYQIPLMSENGEKIDVSRPPKFMGWNGVDYYNNVRIIKSTDSVDALRFVSNQGTQNSSSGGRPKSIHYGVGYTLYSIGGSYYAYQLRNNDVDIKRLSYQVASMDNLDNVVTKSDVQNDVESDYTLDFNKDTRFILEYKLQDPNYMKTNGEALTGNADRGKATGMRVIWASDNVEVDNGYEFYARQNVTLPAEEFNGFTQADNKAEYYKKIAEAAEAKIFKTSSYDFNDLVNGNYLVSSGGSVGFSGLGTAESHQGILNAIDNPGEPQSVTIRYRAADGTTVDRTINLTVGNSVSAITVTDGSKDQTVKHYKDDRTFSVSFNSDKSVNENATTRYAIFRRDSDESNLGICETGSIASDGAVTRITGGGIYGSVKNVTAEVTNTEIILNITHGEHTNRVFKVYMWNEKNGNLNLSTNGTTIDSKYATKGANSDSALKDLNLPVSVTTEYIIPKVSTKYENGVSTIEESNKYGLFYEETSFTVTGIFQLEDSTKEAFDSLISGGDLKVALYKKNPTGNNTGNYVIWATNTGAVSAHTGKVSTPTLSKVSADDPYSFTVSFTIHNSSSSISNQWDDGAKYRIFAWTDSNNLAALGNDDFGKTGDQFQWETEITTVPSTTTTMTGVLGSQVESIIHYPKEIAMMDNVKTENKHIFSANQKITMTPLRVQEGGATVDAEIPDPDSGVDVVIQEIRDKQDAQSSIQISRTVGSANQTINLTCFLGTIESGNVRMISSSGKVGTLYFENTRNELPLYFRSSGATPPAVADGATFTGQIHFIFSKSQSGN